MHAISKLQAMIYLGQSQQVQWSLISQEIHNDKNKNK